MDWMLAAIITNQVHKSIIAKLSTRVKLRRPVVLVLVTELSQRIMICIRLCIVPACIHQMKCFSR